MRSDSPSRPRIHKPAARSATGDFPPGSPAASPKGFCRASSAPPVAPHAAAENNKTTNSPSARRLFTTTTVHHPQQSTGTADSPGLGRRNLQQKSNSSANNSSSSSSGSHVRHIPILVEGRDEPLLPSVAEEGQSAAAADKRSKTAIPMPFYPAENNKKTSAAAATTVPTSASSSPANRSSGKEEPARDASVAIPLPYDRLSDDSGKSAGSSSVDLQTANDLELIERIQRETETLLPRIETFRGDRHDRGFLFLDEM